MKKKILLGILAIFLGFVLYGIFAPRKSPEKTTAFSDRGLDISVVYSQPSKRGRLIFGNEKDGALQPYGKYWRLGANSATEITFSKDIKFAGQPVKAGTYRMYAVPGATLFQICLNSEVGVYFANNEPDYKLDVVKVDLTADMAPETEQFVVNFSRDSNGVNMDLVWERTLVRVPIVLQ